MAEAATTTPRSPAEASGISVVVPALDLEHIVGRTVEALRNELAPFNLPTEVIVVDDGSTDATARVVTSLMGRTAGVRLLRNRRNFGKALSVYLGILAARHSHVFFTDGDLPFSAGCYRQVAEELVRGERVVIASRRMPESQILVRMDVLGYAARRHFVGVTFNRLVRLLLSLSFSDTQCGLKGFDRATALTLFERTRLGGFLFDVELLLAARAEEIRVVEVPVCVEYRDFKSSIQLASSSARMLRGLLEIWNLERRGLYKLPNPEMTPERVGSWTEEVTA